MIDSEICEKCGCKLHGEAVYMETPDEVWCHPCADNAAEAAWERHCNDYEGPLLLIEQQRQALKLK